MNRRTFIRALGVLALAPLAVVKAVKQRFTPGAINPSEPSQWRNVVATYDADYLEDAFWSKPAHLIAPTAREIESVKDAIRQRLGGRIDYFYQWSPHSLVHWIEA